jgi:hypothetical protein
MKTTGLNLLMPDGSDVEREAVARAFERCGGAVHRIGRFWDPPTFAPSSVRVYGGVAFCPLWSMLVISVVSDGP